MELGAALINMVWMHAVYVIVWNDLWRWMHRAADDKQKIALAVKNVMTPSLNNNKNKWTVCNQITHDTKLHICMHSMKRSKQFYCYYLFGFALRK